MKRSALIYLAGFLSCALVLMLVAEWNEFKQLDMARIKRIMRQPILMDGRNIYDRSKMEALGFTYYGIGT